jgi:hypothetical protein
VSRVSDLAQSVSDERSQLGPDSRRRALETMRSEVIDLLVVGAGATGLGTALDAASRGLSVAIIDKGDIAEGTSSRSSKLVHGGLRYLQQGNVALVREALRERDLLLTTLAPHLVEPLPFLLPLHHRVWERAYVGAGLLAYDMLAGSSVLPRHRHVTKKTALARFPSLRSDALVGALQYYDAQMDDSRLASPSDERPHSMAPGWPCESPLSGDVTIRRMAATSSSCEMKRLVRSSPSRRAASPCAWECGRPKPPPSSPGHRMLSG